MARFVAESTVDALAVSIGTSHGVYRSLPNLAIDRLKLLNEASTVPLVLHGGSGTPADQIQAAVRHGICKLNIYADCRIAMGRGLQAAARTMQREDPLPQELFGAIKQEIARSGDREDPVAVGRRADAWVAGRCGMKLLAISDTYIPLRVHAAGSGRPWQTHGVTVEVRRWEHASLVELQQANLAIEQGGPEAVALPAELLADLDDVRDAGRAVRAGQPTLAGRPPALRVIGVVRGGTENVDMDDGHGAGHLRAEHARAQCAGRGRMHAGPDPGRRSATLPARTPGCERALAARVSQQPGDSGTVRQDRGAGRLRCRGPAGGALSGGLWQSHPGLRPVFPGRSGAGATRAARRAAAAIRRRFAPRPAHCREPSFDRRRELARMKRSAILVNTARSGLVDEAALVEALRERARSWAPRSTCSTREPLPADHPLLQLDNVTVTPHLAGSTIDAFRNSPALMAQHLIRLLTGERASADCQRSATRHCERRDLKDDHSRRA